ncbi:hypothetical protein [Halalkalibacter flavus]|uniref:hypothetical protein n=1 Tax=Halalkalibacter flavus TaxID=3090668 RepID=UPI002FC9F542
MREAVIVQKLSIARCGVYKATIKIYDLNQNKLIETFEREYPRKQRGYVQRTSLDSAFELCRSLGFDHVRRVDTASETIYYDHPEEVEECECSAISN